MNKWLREEKGIAPIVFVLIVGAMFLLSASALSRTSGITSRERASLSIPFGAQLVPVKSLTYDQSKARFPDGNYFKVTFVTNSVQSDAVFGISSGDGANIGDNKRAVSTHTIRVVASPGIPYSTKGLKPKANQYINTKTGGARQFEIFVLEPSASWTTTSPTTVSMFRDGVQIGNVVNVDINPSSPDVVNIGIEPFIARVEKLGFFSTGLGTPTVDFLVVYEPSGTSFIPHIVKESEWNDQIIAWNRFLRYDIEFEFGTIDAKFSQPNSFTYSDFWHGVTVKSGEFLGTPLTDNKITWTGFKNKVTFLDDAFDGDSNIDRNKATNGIQIFNNGIKIFHPKYSFVNAIVLWIKEENAGVRIISFSEEVRNVIPQIGSITLDRFVLQDTGPDSSTNMYVTIKNIDYEGDIRVSAKGDHLLFSPATTTVTLGHNEEAIVSFKVTAQNVDVEQFNTIAIVEASATGGTDSKQSQTIFIKDVGLQGDRDGDGIPDNKDQCPDDPEDYDGFQDEDGCPEEGGIEEAIRCPDGRLVTNVAECEKEPSNFFRNIVIGLIAGVIALFGARSQGWIMF